MAGGEYGVRASSRPSIRTPASQYGNLHHPARRARNDSWKGDTWKTGAGSTWGVGSYDPNLNLVYWSTSNAGPWVVRRAATIQRHRAVHQSLDVLAAAFNAETGKSSGLSDDAFGRLGLRRHQ